MLHRSIYCLFESLFTIKYKEDTTRMSSLHLERTNNYDIIQVLQIEIAGLFPQTWEPLNYTCPFSRVQFNLRCIQKFPYAPSLRRIREDYYSAPDAQFSFPFSLSFPSNRLHFIMAIPCALSARRSTFSPVWMSNKSITSSGK